MRVWNEVTYHRGMRVIVRDEVATCSFSRSALTQNDLVPNLTFERTLLHVGPFKLTVRRTLGRIMSDLRATEHVVNFNNVKEWP